MPGGHQPYSNQLGPGGLRSQVQRIWLQPLPHSLVLKPQSARILSRLVSKSSLATQLFTCLFVPAEYLDTIVRKGTIVLVQRPDGAWCFVAEYSETEGWVTLVLNDSCRQYWYLASLLAWSEEIWDPPLSHRLQKGHLYTWMKCPSSDNDVPRSVACTLFNKADLACIATQSRDNLAVISPMEHVQTVTQFHNPTGVVCRVKTAK